MKNINNLSRFISLILRHKPEVINIKLDKHGYANVEELINGINNNKKYTIDFDLLKQIVDTDNKKRYSFNEDFTKIRANQGHSIDVDVELKECKPPKNLYHGSSGKYFDSIIDKNIICKRRLYVQLSKDYDTDYTVGSRNGRPIVFIIDSERMYKDGYKFYLSENNVWLTKHVPKEYINIMINKELMLIHDKFIK